MTLPLLKKFMSEKIAGAKGTELDDEFHDMEKKVDVMGKLVDELMARTMELLQPNPASRAKLSAVNLTSKIRGQAKTQLYPQPEGLLGECMFKHGRDLGDESLFGQALVESGEAYKQMADVKYALEDNVKQNFIEPLHHLQSKDLKEVNHHRKKLSGRRLDYDCKKRKKDKGAHVSDADIQIAEEKFEESKMLSETAMYNLLDNDVEQLSQLSAFVESMVDYHRQSLDILQSLQENIQQKQSEATSRPRQERVVKRVASNSRLSNASRDASPMFESSPSGFESNSLNAPPSYGKDSELESSVGFQQPISSSSSSYQTELSTVMTSGGGGAASAVAAGGASLLQQDPWAVSNAAVSSMHAVSQQQQQSTLWPTQGHVIKPPAYSAGSQRLPAMTNNANGGQPCCRALYDFDPENEGELGFKENDIVTLISRIDENWYEGSFRGKSGFFPCNYVEVVVDLP